MKSTLLEAVQEILADMDSDEVNSISDTVESDQVARILRSCFYDIANDIQLLEHKTTFALESAGDTDLPTVFYMPENVTRLDKVMYDHKIDDETEANYQPVEWVDFDEFISRSNGLREQDSGTGEATLEGDNSDSFTFIYRTDAHPTYFTTYNNNTIIFDSYDEDEQDTLTSGRMLCTGTVYPTFSLEDDFTPELDPTQFRYWINKAKVRAFANLKQSANPDAAAEARRQRIITQKRKRSIATKPEVKYIEARYGRK